MWHRFALSGASVVIGFFGFVNLASLAAQHGLEWHSLVKYQVQEYRQTMYPLYDAVLKPISIFLKIRFPPEVKDSISCLLLSFAAANSESLLRDGRPVWNSAIGAIRPALTALNSKTEPRIPVLPKTFISSAFPQLGLILYVVAVLGSLGSIYGTDFIFHVVFQGKRPLVVVPWWLSTWASAYWIGGAVGFAAYVVRVMDTEPRKYRWVEFVAWPIAVTIALPAIVICVGIALVAFTLLLAEILFVFLLFSPFAAWRTVLVTLTAFGIVVFLNQAVLNGLV